MVKDEETGFKNLTYNQNTEVMRFFDYFIVRTFYYSMWVA